MSKGTPTAYRKPWMMITLGTLIALLGVFAPPAAAAEDDAFPTKTIRLIIPSAPGGSADVIARLITQKLSERLLTQGPAAFNRRELLALLRNADSMTEVHDRLWKMPDRQLPDWWKMAMRHYNVLLGRPRTPLYR